MAILFVWSDRRNDSSCRRSLLTSPALAVWRSQRPRRSASCSAFGFVPADSATGYDYAGGKRIPRLNGGKGFFVCPQGLPTRAVVTKVQFSIWDGNGLYELKYCGLYRSGLDTAANAETVRLASMGPTGISQARASPSDPGASIQNATVDATNHVYGFECDLSGDGGESLGIYGTTVTYTISAANG